MAASAGKVAVVTGTSSGFGRLIAQRLAHDGYTVVAGVRKLESGAALLEDARALGCSERVQLVELDVTNESRVREVMQRAAEEHGRIDVLLNNAGFALGGFAEDVPLAEWRRQLETNLFGAIACTQQVLPVMRRQRAGKIINISSVSGRIASPALGPYATSKHALEGFTEALRFELLPFGIYAVLVEPGAYKTDIWRKGLGEAVQPADSAYAGQWHTVRKAVESTARHAGDPREVADLVSRIAAEPRPKLRYPVGRGIRAAIWWKHVLPWSMVERMFRRLL